MSPISTLTPRDPQQSFNELLSLTQLFLLREHQLTDKCRMSREAFLSIKPHVSPSKHPIHPPQYLKEQLVESRPLPLQQVNKLTDEESKAEPNRLDDSPRDGRTVTEEVIKAKKLTEKVNMDEKASPPPPQKISPEIDSKPIKEKRSLVLETMDCPAAPASLSFKDFFKEHFPHYPLSDVVPKDHAARKARDAWLIKQQIQPVIILSFDEKNQSLAFLKNIAKAISLRLAPACVLSGTQLEKEQQWEKIFSTPALRLIIACDYELYLQPGLMQHYRSVQSSAKHYLKDTPLLLLSDLSLYLKKPELKLLLWNAICNEFDANHSSFG